MELEPENESDMINNKLLEIIEYNCKTNDEKYILNKYKQYINLFENDDDKEINIDDIYEDIGYNQKVRAKTLLIKHFDKDDYLINKATNNNIKGGLLKEDIMISMKVFKKLCLLSRTKDSKKIYNFLKGIEEIIKQYNNDSYNNILPTNSTLTIIKNKNIIKELKDKLYDKYNIFYKCLNIYKIINNNKKHKFIINLEDLCDLIGYTRKSQVKKTLCNIYKNNIDYMILNEDNGEYFNKDGGKPIETILLTLECFKDFCINTSKIKEANEIYAYYIEMENILNQYLNNSNNTLEKILNDDKLLKLLNDNFNTDEQQLFINQFKLYLEYGNDNTKFIIDFDDIWVWLGFTLKANAKKVLLKHFIENKDFIQLDEKTKGRPIQYIKINITTFKKFCMVSATSKSFEIYDYYIKMEEIYNQYLKEKLIENNKKNEINKIYNKSIEKELSENKKIIEENKELLQLKNDEITELKKNEKIIKYEEVDKDEYVYILTTDIDGVYKIGKSARVMNRKKELNINCVKEVKIIYTYKTHNMTLLEHIVHNILDEYRTKSKREHFRCRIGHIKNVIKLCGIFIDTLKSTFENINYLEITEKIKNKLEKNVEDE
tara:strand:+ start:420 stop:2228 length:1809 start_codon:yes stop_codon:yes gene_type:complete